jgi:hypothetical protein
MLPGRCERADRTGCHGEQLELSAGVAGHELLRLAVRTAADEAETKVHGTEGGNWADRREIVVLQAQTSIAPSAEPVATINPEPSRGAAAIVVTSCCPSVPAAACGPGSSAESRCRRIAPIVETVTMSSPAADRAAAIA